MKKVDKVVSIIKQILADKPKTNDIGRLHKYIGMFDRESFLKSAKTLGTPQYILNREELRKRAETFRDAFRQQIPKSEFFYAFKCNDFPGVIKTLKESGFKADVAGIFELELALRIGFERIIFTGPGKSDEELELAIKNKERVVINIDNIDELLRLKKLAVKHKIEGKIDVSFRLNSGEEITKVWSKFGIHLSEFRGVYESIEEHPHINWVGLHFHSSWNETPAKYVENIKVIANYLKNNFSKEELTGLKFFDIGGGFYPEDQAFLTKTTPKGSVYELVRDYSKKNPKFGFDPHDFSIDHVDPLPLFAKKIAFHFKKYLLSLNPDLEVWMEPGRFIATHSTSILLKVIATKQDCVIVDGGINMFGDYRFYEYAFPIIVNVSRPSHKLNRKIIYGSLCDPSDVWGYSYFGDGIRKGDILAVLHQGAYTFSCAWRFIKPTAKYVVLSGKELSVGKKEEKFEDRYSGCDI